LKSQEDEVAVALGLALDFALSEEIIRYHAAYQPHKKATLAYLRADA